MKTLLSGQANKVIVALLAAAATLLQHWSGDWWEPAVVTLLGAVSVFLVSNAPAAAAELPPVTVTAHPVP